MQRRLLISALAVSLTSFTGFTLSSSDVRAESHVEPGGEGKGKHHGGKFKRLDTNEDGIVTRDEFRAHTDKKFDRMDADKDGQITREEAKAFKDKIREHRKKFRESLEKEL